MKYKQKIKQPAAQVKKPMSKLSIAIIATGLLTYACMGAYAVISWKSELRTSEQFAK